MMSLTNYHSFSHWGSLKAKMECKKVLFKNSNILLAFTRTIFVMTVFSELSGAQKSTFSQHYDDVHKNSDRDRSSDSSNPYWNTHGQNNSNNYRLNTKNDPNYNSSNYYYEHQQRTKFDDKELRENPNHDNINWLSPNPFAKAGPSSSSAGIGRSRSDYNSGSGSVNQYENRNRFAFSSNTNNNYDPNNDPARYNNNNNQQQTYNNDPNRDRDRSDRDRDQYNKPQTDLFNNSRRYNDEDGFNNNNAQGRTIPSGSLSPNDNNVIPGASIPKTDIRDQNSGNFQPQSPQTNFGNPDYPGSSNFPTTPVKKPDENWNVGPNSGIYGNADSHRNSQYPNTNNPGYNSNQGRSGGSNYNSESRPGGSNYHPSSSGGNPGNYPYPNSGRGNQGSYPHYPGSANFDPGHPNVNIWNEHFSTTTYRPTAAGVLGKWRPDLQGQQRPEDIHQVPQPVYVVTTYGNVQGFRVKLYDGPWVPLPARPGVANVDKVKAQLHSFVGIPYARAPTGEGRFRPPRSHPGWQVHQAVEFGPACPQPSRFFGYSAGIVQVDEDCLYLNVFSPDVGSGVEGAPFPVIFYIHDGDFIHGASNQFPPHQLVAWYKVVVVTVNFRLGSLGFLSTADEYSPGNYGMLDLSMALKWVHSNIRSFNGDPDRITLVGLGSGAAAAGLLMLSPRSKQYVKNVVALEGAPTAEWAAIEDKYRLQNTTELYSFKMGCWQEWDRTSWKVIQCLRQRSWQELANLELEPDVGTFPWSPAVDKTFKVPKDDILNDWREEDWRFLPDTPYNLLKRGEYPLVKYMTGFSRQSAADLLYENKTLAPNFVVTRPWFDQMIHRWVKKYNYTLNPEGVYSAIKYAYTYWPDPLNTTHLREEYIEFLSDALYRAPVDETVKLLLARGIQVHSYLLNYTLEGLRLPFWREVPRGMEYYLLSGAPFMDPEFYPERLRIDRFAWTEGDRNMSDFLMSSVANMAHYGHPTPKEVRGLFWERATPADLKYLALNATNNSTMQRNYRQRELTFWSNYMPSVVGRYVPTYPPTTEYWWEPNEPLQIAFWTVSGICLILIVALVACCLLWRTAKKQRDRLYDDLGLGSEPLGIGTIVGDDVSEYADTVKTGDSMDSGVKLSHHPNASGHSSMNMHQMQMFTSQPQMHIHGGQRDRFPTPIKRNLKERGDTPQTQV